MAVDNEDLRAFFIQTPVVNGWHHHGSLNAVGGGFETCVHIYHANSLLSEISPHAFFPGKPSCQKVVLLLWLINPVELTRCRHLFFLVVGIIKIEKEFLFLKR